MKFYFLSRHTATQEQVALANDLDIEIVQAADVDAFTWSARDFIRAHPDADGVVCVHPMVALNASVSGLKVAIFENGTRAAEGEKPSFFAKKLHLWWSK